MKLKTTLLAAALLMAGSLAHAVTLRVANLGDVQSMDPHSLNETLQLSFTASVYEPLVGRDKKMNLIPLLATQWSQKSPTVWRFSLRKGVKFHDGTPFGADDVVFSFKRAAGDGSDMKGYTSAIKEVRKVDDFTVDIETTAPFPILPDVISLVYIMNKSWCEANKAEKPVDRRKGIENAASFRTNGTGPFRTKERQPATRTVLVRNFNYWGKVEGNVDEVVFTPIGNDATRVAALVSGEIDLMEPVPLQDVERLKANPNLKVMQGPELRTIFLGMDQKRDELLFSNVKGKNPFKDIRVRQAMAHTIDANAIRTSVMRGLATTSMSMIAPQVRGYTKDVEKRWPLDLAKAKKLMAEAGYPNGFEVTLDCPNNRYINDEKICVAISGMLAKIDIKIKLNSMPRATYFPKIQTNDTSMYLLGWGVPTFDSLYTLQSILRTKGQGGDGNWNFSGYSNAKLDAIVDQLKTEIDFKKRADLTREALLLDQADVGHIPLHHQVIPWAMRSNVTVVHRPDNRMHAKWAVVK